MAADSPGTHRRHEGASLLRLSTLGGRSQGARKDQIDRPDQQAEATERHYGRPQSGDAVASGRALTAPHHRTGSDNDDASDKEENAPLARRHGRSLHHSHDGGFVHIRLASRLTDHRPRERHPEPQNSGRSDALHHHTSSTISETRTPHSVGIRAIRTIVAGAAGSSWLRQRRRTVDMWNLAVIVANGQRGPLRRSQDAAPLDMMGKMPG